jgi:hypothetical protein
VRADAIRMLSTWLGGLILARIGRGRPLSDEVLAACGGRPARGSTRGRPR